MSKKPKTRNTSGSKIEDLLGKGQELLQSDVPTLRSALRLAIFLQKEFVVTDEGDRRNYPISLVMKDVAQAVIQQWLKSNAEFVPPVVVTQKSLTNRLERAWEKYSSISWGKEKSKVKEDWMNKLDLLLDITVCR